MRLFLFSSNQAASPPQNQDPRRNQVHRSSGHTLWIWGYMNRVILAIFHKRLVGPATTPVRHLTSYKDFGPGGVKAQFASPPCRHERKFAFPNFRLRIFSTAQPGKKAALTTCTWTCACFSILEEALFRRHAMRSKHTNTGFRPVCSSRVYGTKAQRTPHRPTNTSWMTVCSLHLRLTEERAGTIRMVGRAVAKKCL